MTGPAVVETAWMVDAVCARRLDLPWTLDADQVGTWERVTMTVLCNRYTVRAACDSYAELMGADAGFWAGSHRVTDTNTLAAAVIAAEPSWVAQLLPGLPDLDGAA